jgi:predicted DNA-binding transcriptional regulator AlpA
MTASAQLLTLADVADRFGITESQARDMRLAHGWPCVHLSRKAIRFTEEQVEQIIAAHVKQSKTSPASTPPAITGQTARSKRRRGS